MHQCYTICLGVLLAPRKEVIAQGIEGIVRATWCPQLDQIEFKQGERDAEVEIVAESAEGSDLGDASSDVKSDIDESGQIKQYGNGGGSAQRSVDLGCRYSVQEKLGEGASAEVYKVIDKVLGKTFAAKVMRTELLPDEVARRRFAQEAEAASALTHANLVAIYGHGETASNAPFLVMDCLDGKTLSQTLKSGGAFDAERAIDVGIQACEALVHMHMKSIVHRDLKPSNMFLTKDENNYDVLKIVDFGIAKLQYSAAERTQLTQTGEVFGSPLYMSPEQCRGESLDCRSDIYSLGCVLYELVSGVSPFAAPNPIKTILKHVSGAVPPFKNSAPDKHIPEGLQSVIFKCLKTEPQDRYQIVEELLNDLKTLRDSGKVKADVREVYASKWRRTTAFVLDGAILSLLSMGILWVAGTSFSTTLMAFLGSMFAFSSALLGPLGGLMIGWTLIGNPKMIALFPAVWSLVLLMVLGWLYYAGCEASRYKATPGKLAMGLAVVDEHGKRISFLRATKRYVSRANLLTLAPLETRLRVMSLPFWKRFVFTWRETFRNIDHPPTDDWNKCYVVNASMLDNPYIPQLSRKFKQEKLDLTEIHRRVKEFRSHLIAGLFYFGLSVLIMSTVTWQFISGETPSLTHAMICMLWITVLYYNFAMNYPTLGLYLRVRSQKKKLLEERKTAKVEPRAGE